MEDIKQTVDAREAARILGSGRDAVYQAIRAGKIKVIRLGRRILISRIELERILREGLE